MSIHRSSQSTCSFPSLTQLGFREPIIQALPQTVITPYPRRVAYERRRGGVRGSVDARTLLAIATGSGYLDFLPTGVMLIATTGGAHPDIEQEKYIARMTETNLRAAPRLTTNNENRQSGGHASHSHGWMTSKMKAYIHKASTIGHHGKFIRPSPAGNLKQLTTPSPWVIIARPSAFGQKT
ncbi:hypothetical protein PSPO01_10859 [Paraphaeosphaeria sporulosa]